MARNPNTPPEVLEVLARDQLPGVREAVVTNINTDDHMLSVLARDPLAYVRKAEPSSALASEGKTASRGDSRVDLALVQNTPAEALADLLRRNPTPIPSPEAEKFKPVTISRDAPIFRMTGWFRASDLVLDLMTPDRLYGDDVWLQGVRQLMAAHRGAPEEVLATLAEDPDTASRVAHNARAPQRALPRLAYNPLASIRGEVAGNPNTPSESLRILALDEDSFVRARVARNPNCPPDVANELADDPDEKVRRTDRTVADP